MAETWEATGNGLPFNRIVEFHYSPGKDFLLLRSGSQYFAHFTNGGDEEITPIDGLPRPDPETAVKTKNYKVPLQLRDAQRYTKASARFTGRMRLTVAQFHGRGEESPFHSTYTKTHGIVCKATVLPPPLGTPKNKYWVVEIITTGADKGIYTAPVQFLESNSITKSLKPSSLFPYYSSIAFPGPSTNSNLDLAWAFSVALPGVEKIYGGSGFPDGDQSPFYEAYGWAFSKSGHEAQNIVGRRVFQALSDPNELNRDIATAELMRVNRYKLEFGTTGSDISNLSLTATLSNPDAEKLFIMNRGNVDHRMYVPFSEVSGDLTKYKYTSRAAGTVHLETPQPDITGLIHAPIHVHYNDDTEFIVYYHRDAETTRTPFSGGGTAGWVTTPINTTAHCQLGNYSKGTAPSYGGDATAGVTQTPFGVGFVFPGSQALQTIVDIFDITVGVSKGATSNPPDFVRNINIPGPDCNGDAGLYSVTDAFEDQAYVETQTGSSTLTRVTHACLLSVEDRECMFTFGFQQAESSVTSGNRATVGGTTKMNQTGARLSGTGTWEPKVDVHSGSAGPGIGGIPGATTPSVAYFPYGQYIIGKNVLSYGVTAVANAITNTGLVDLFHPAALPPPLAPLTKAKNDTQNQTMHGNLLDVLVELTPNDQRLNYARRTDGVPIRTGGYNDTQRERIIAFIGRS